MPIQLRKDSTQVQVSISLRCRLWEFLFELHGELQLDQSRPEMTLLAVVARKVVVGHGPAVVVVLGKL